MLRRVPTVLLTLIVIACLCPVPLWAEDVDAGKVRLPSAISFSGRTLEKGVYHVRIADSADGPTLVLISKKGEELLKEADYEPAAQLLEPSLVEAAIGSIKAHLDKHRDLRAQAIEENLIST